MGEPTGVGAPPETPAPPGPPDWARTYRAPGVIRPMLLAAQALLAALTHEQRLQAWYGMSDSSRLDWDFAGKPDRVGVPLSELDQYQRALAQTLLRSGLSLRGYTQALQIMSMENVLREVESPTLGVAAGPLHSPDQYFVAFYGRPAFEDTWGWRFLGHHLSLNYTIIGQEYLTATPCGLGAQPARAGLLDPVGAEEELAYALLAGMTGEQRERAVIHGVAPPDFVTRRVPRIGLVEYPDHHDLGRPGYAITDADREALAFHANEPRGVAGAALPTEHWYMLRALIETVLSRAPVEVAREHLDRVEADGRDNVHFCWAGPQRRGEPHYFRVQGSHLLLEFVNAADSGDHIHSIWRDYRNDLGHDLLTDHYDRIHAAGSHLTTRTRSSVPLPAERD
jgi:Protein of unknown function (DUF3500)